MKILEVCKVAPSPISPNDMSIPLCFFDLIWLRFPPVEFLSFYESSSFSETLLITRLKSSLSLTLGQFLPLSGNLVWPANSSNPIVRYKKGNGVLFTVAQSDDDFYHLSRKKIRATSIFPPLIPESTGSDTKVPILAIKVTIFPNKGFCIGGTLHHAAMDASAFSMFCKLWASTSKYGENSNLIPNWTPIFDRNPISERYSQLEDLYIQSLLNQDVANPKGLAIIKIERKHDTVRGTFQISASEIKKLKKIVLKHEALSSDLALTTFNVTLAYIILCSVKAKEKKGKKVAFGIVVDFRARLEPPLSPNYAGNCIGFVDGNVEKDEITGDDGIIAAMKAIHKMRKKLDEEVLKGAENWLASSEDEFEKDYISIAGSTNLDVYGSDFGWGKPTKVDISSIDKTGAINLIKGRDGDGGVEIELCLSKFEMEKFALAFHEGFNKVRHIKAAL